MAFTTYSNLSDIELLKRLECKKGLSPIIDELLDRLETTIENNTTKQVTCHICEAKFELPEE